MLSSIQLMGMLGTPFGMWNDICKNMQIKETETSNVVYIFI